MMLDTAAARPQIALFAAAPADEDAVQFAGAIDWLTCRTGAGSAYEFFRGQEKVATLDRENPVWTLPDVVAILGVADQTGLHALARIFEEVLPATRVAVEWVGATDPLTLLGRALHHCSTALIDQRRQSGRMALDLASYRGEFDKMQQRFARLEAFFAQAGLGSLRDVFSVAHSGKTIQLKPGPVAAADGVPMTISAVRMVLPVDSLGVAALWIYVTSVPAPGGPQLLIRLCAIETGAACASWMLDPGSAQAGWTQFTLRRAIDEAALSLTLTLSCSAPPDSDGQDGWGIGLAPPNPFAAFCASYGFAPPAEAEPPCPHLPDGRLGAPLALRVQAALPGTTPPISLASVPETEGRRPAICRLTDADCASVREVLPEGAEDAAPLVHYDQEFDFIQVHPRGGGAVTAGRMAIAAPAGTWRLTASVHLAHASANPAEFGILARLPGAQDPGPASFAACNDETPCFSGWCTLDALERRTISTILPEHGGKGLVIYLVTRQTDAPSFAWARFSDLQLHFLPGGGT